MSIDTRYRNEIDSFCAETYKVSGEEMLEMAKRNNINMTNTASSARARFTKRALLIPIAAALFGMTAVTAAAGAAGYGPLSGLSETFGKYFGDEATEKLAEEGYVYTADDYAADSAPEKEDPERVYAVMGETVIKDGFTAKVIGIAGDTQSPQMLIDLTVEDAEAAEQSDILGLYVLTLGTEEFEQHREDYLEEYGKAVKDDQIPNLYHASVRCPPAWVTSGQEVVVDIVCIHTTEDNPSGTNEYYRDEEVSDRGFSTNAIGADNYYSKIKEYFPEMQFRFTIPENVFKTSAYMTYDELDLGYEIGNYPYRLCSGEFGAHESWITLDFELGSGCSAEEFNSEYNNWLAAKSIAEKFTLTVDGKEYLPDLEKTGIYCDTNGDCNLCIKNRCYLSLSFPAIDFDAAASVVLTGKDDYFGTEASHELKVTAAHEEPEAPDEEKYDSVYAPWNTEADGSSEADTSDTPAEEKPAAPADSGEDNTESGKDTAE